MSIKFEISTFVSISFWASVTCCWFVHAMWHMKKLSRCRSSSLKNKPMWSRHDRATEHIPASWRRVSDMVFKKEQPCLSPLSHMPVNWRHVKPNIRKGSGSHPHGSSTRDAVGRGGSSRGRWWDLNGDGRRDFLLCQYSCSPHWVAKFTMTCLFTDSSLCVIKSRQVVDGRLQGSSWIGLMREKVHFFFHILP